MKDIVIMYDRFLLVIVVLSMSCFDIMTSPNNVDWNRYCIEKNLTRNAEIFFTNHRSIPLHNFLKHEVEDKLDQLLELDDYERIKHEQGIVELQKMQEAFKLYDYIKKQEDLWTRGCFYERMTCEEQRNFNRNQRSYFTQIYLQKNKPKDI